MKLIHTIIFILIISFTYSQVKLVHLDNRTLPHNISIEGHIIDAVSFSDKMGQNIVITTETGEIASKTKADDDNRNAYVYAYHYLSKNDSFIRTWRVIDFVKDCPLDLWAKYIKNSFAVTDLDNDRYAEVWMMYNTKSKYKIAQ